MSATLVRISFAIIVADSDHWTKEHIQEWADSEMDCADFVRFKVETAMREAGEKVVDDNPDLFRGDLV